ncbi:M4 family metallopeptidase [Microtetraspora sp. NBRC 16547]|uniref:M4 family metallopeptidase n=1 Tax=Microtetraspora sp. NBRC 16547 TaxID=3030993 RepID=UPI0024A59163|nr:M4 family metallopeptidase [Microtetraspora sp. NBRC 16547]GLX02420.1 zinc metalloprotease [Microtetraspora sp. NBRC 16547]
MKRTAALALITTTAGLLVALTGTSSAGASPAVDPGQAARGADRLVDAKPPALRPSAKDGFRREKVVEGRGGLNYVSYTRTYGGLPVYGGDFVVVTDAKGGVLSTSVAQEKTLSVGTTPKLTADQATEVARAQISEVTTTSAPQLTVMAEGTGRLAYEVVAEGVNNGRESKMHVLVDALTGEVVEKSDEVVDGQGNSYYNGNPVTIGTTSGSTFSMADPARSGVRCGGQNGSTYTKATDSWGNGSGTDLETACVDALFAVGKEWDMLRDWLGRNGINGTGGGFPARVGLADVNAYWNGSYTNFGHSQDNKRQATPIDVVAHEYGHAVFQNTPGGSTGSNEKGILNESTGDVFGALTEHYANEPAGLDTPDYSVGEMVDLVGSGPIRYMHKPSLISGNPDCYSSSVPNMEVHAGAGIQNHWFYLLAEGSNPTNGNPVSPTCNGSTVTGVGIQKAGQIFMETLNRKTSTWTHSLVRKASLEAALQLFPGSCAEFNRTKAAWDAVSVPAASGEPASCNTTGNDFSLTLNPASASVQAGQQATATVATQTTSGTAQGVTFSATGLPAGVTAAFNPSSVTSGSSSTMTVTTSASTASGSYPITVTGTGGSATHTATFTLTVGGGSGPCSGRQNTATGTLSSGSSAYQPSTSGFQTTKTGTHVACLSGPTGADFDLYLQKKNSLGLWTNVASGTTASPNESFTYTGTAGTYRYRVYSYSGSGAYTLGYDAP